MNEILIGCDPELFIKQGDQLISAEGVIGGTKYEPIWSNDGEYSLQEDNVMAEIGIKPASDAETFSKRISQAIEAIKSKGVGISLNASETFLEAALNTNQAQESGCQPDFNCYEKAMNAPVDLSSITTRYSGGHIHIGLGTDRNQWMKHYDVDKVIMSLDHHLGLPLLEKERMTTVPQYRRIGNFRVKSYGVEYRTLSNSWIFKHEDRVNVFKKAKDAVLQSHQISKEMEQNLSLKYYSMK